MSLARTALRLAAIAALEADPVITALCADRIYDSRIDELDAKEAVPLIVVYTEDDMGRAWSANNGGPPFDHVCDLQLEISMRATTRDEGSDAVAIEMPETDREIDASLDLLEEKAVEAVTIANTPEAYLIRTAVTRRTTDLKSVRYTSAVSGAKMAMRLVTLTTQLKGDQPDVFATPTGPFGLLPDPLRTVAEALAPGSSGYATCLAIAAALSPPADALLKGVDVTMVVSGNFDPANPPRPGDPTAATPILQPIDIPS